jgi:hypothetical protein
MKKKYLCLFLIAQMFLTSNLLAGGSENDGPIKKSSYLASGVAFFTSLFFVSQADGAKIHVVSAVPPVAARDQAHKNSTAELMSKRVVRGAVCDGCVCDPCPTLDCCDQYNTCATELSTCDGRLTGCELQRNEYAAELTTCEANSDVLQAHLGNCESALTADGNSLSICQTSLFNSQQAAATCAQNLASAQSALATSQNTLFAVGQVCTNVNGCYQDIMDPSLIRSALENIPNITVTDEMVQGVRNYLSSGLTAGHCAQATGQCNGAQFPAACKPAASSGSSMVSPQYGMIAALVGGSIVLNHHELISDATSQLFDVIQCGVSKLSNRLFGASNSVE